MPFNLLRCPFLVQKEIILKMILQEAFSLSTTSKKSLILVKCCLSRQRFHIQYNVFRAHHSIEVIRKSTSTDVIDKMRVTNHLLVEPTWKFLDLDAIVIYGEFARVMVRTGYADNMQSMIKVYQYLMNLFPKETINLKFGATDGDPIARIMEVAKVDEVETGPACNDDATMVQQALDQFANIKKLRILNTCRCPRINPESQFEMDHLYIRDGDGWIKKGQIIQNFLNCKQVVLPHTSFGYYSRDYPEFVESWMRGSKMELLKVGGRWIDMHRITDTVGVLPGAVEIRRARVWEDKEQSENRNFAAGCCYMVQQTGGTRAIVAWSRREFLLTTKFEVLEEAMKRTADQ